MRIQNVTKICSGTNLVLRIVELENEEKDYEAIQIKVENGEWINVPISGIESHESATVTVNNLPTNSIQRVMAQVKLINGVWETVQDTSFVVQEPVRVPITSIESGVL